MIYFRVHHANKLLSTFTDTKPIGLFKVDVSTVYNEKEHSFERKWAQLMNPDSIELPCGHLLVSIAVSERGSSSKVGLVGEFVRSLKRSFLQNILGEINHGDDEMKPS